MRYVFIDYNFACVVDVGYFNGNGESFMCVLLAWVGDYVTPYFQSSLVDSREKPQAVVFLFLIALI